MINIFEAVKEEQGELVALRRHFHEYPELSKQEDQTIAYIAKKLDEYGISYRLVDQGGLIAWIEARDRERPCSFGPTSMPCPLRKAKRISPAPGSAAPATQASCMPAVTTATWPCSSSRQNY